METVINGVNRAIPRELEGRKLIPYTGPHDRLPEPRKARPYFGDVRPGDKKLLDSIDEAIERTGLRDGMCVSFHHHLRDGDRVVNLVMQHIADKGIRGIKVAPSALFPVHEPLIAHMDEGVITSIEGSMNGPVGDAVSHGRMKKLTVLRSHGGRVRAIQAGDIRIDVAFIAAPCADEEGNCNGRVGQNACGPLGYAKVDSFYARKVVVITDNLVTYPCTPMVISAPYVDHVVEIDSIGDHEKIVSGTTKVATDPLKLSIAQNAVDLMVHTGIFKEGMRFQAGAGGIALATTKILGDLLEEKGLVADFINGGVTQHVVDIYNKGCTRKIFNGQSFDVASIKDLNENPDHVEISPDYYANPWNKGCLANLQDAVVLGATEVDVDFNVNVNTHSDGRLLHGIGGHQDTAPGAKLSMMTVPLFRKDNPIIRERVTNVTTPCHATDAVVTDAGIAINPARKDLLKKLEKSPLKILDIRELKDMAYAQTGVPPEPEFEDRVVTLIEYRDGTALDVVRQIKE
jgi:citrate lyase subunit alpha/citrate CoA-transferase